jgi:hypothetical protein
MKFTCAHESVYLPSEVKQQRAHPLYTTNARGVNE